MDVQTLRPHIIALSIHREKDFPAISEALELPPPGREGYKSDKMAAAFDAFQDGNLATTGSRHLDQYAMRASDRNAIQDILSADIRCPEVNRKGRRQVANAIEIEDLYIDAKRYEDLLDGLWDLDSGGGMSLDVIISRGAIPDNSLRSQSTQARLRKSGRLADITSIRRAWCV